MRRSGQRRLHVLSSDRRRRGSQALPSLKQGIFILYDDGVKLVYNYIDRRSETGESVRLKYSYIFGGSYLLLAVLYVLVLFAQIGHGSNPFDFVFYLNRPACYVLDLFPDLTRTRTALPQILSCLLAGLFQFALIGYLMDRVMSFYRKRAESR